MPDLLIDKNFSTNPIKRTIIRLRFSSALISEEQHRMVVIVSISNKNAMVYKKSEFLVLSKILYKIINKFVFIN